MCLKVPTGGGKTLLVLLRLKRLQKDLFTQQTGIGALGSAVGCHLQTNLETVGQS